MVLDQSVLYHKVSSPTMQERLLFVVPTSLQKQFLRRNHDESGHQQADRTMARLSRRAYGIGMSKEISSYCNCCFICQQTKAPTSCPALLQPVVASRPWELVVVDILKAPMSHRGKQYMLVVQDYFSKWPFAIPLSDQRADTTVYESSKIMYLP